MNEQSMACLSRAIIASATVISMAYMYVNAVNEVMAACVGAFGLGTFLMIPKCKTKREGAES